MTKTPVSRVVFGIPHSTFAIPCGTRAAHSAQSIDRAEFRSFFAVIVQEQDS
jgi:hypothetical protein